MSCVCSCADMKLRLHHKLSHSLHIHPTTWSLVCGFSALFYAVKYISEHGEDTPDQITADGEVAADEGTGLLGSFADFVVDGEAYSNGTLNATAVSDAPAGALTKTESVLAILVPSVLGWVLLAGQTYVMLKVKAGIHNALRARGCESANDLPEYLRKLDAEVEMKYHVPRMWVFVDCGDSFVDALMTELSLDFYMDGDAVIQRQSTLSSLIIVGHGECNVVDSKGTFIGKIDRGHYVGESSLLRDEQQETALIATGSVSIFTLRRESLDKLADEYPAAVQRLLEFGEQKYKASFGVNHPEDDGVLRGWLDKLKVRQLELQDQAAAIMQETMQYKAKTNIRAAAAAKGKAAFKAGYQQSKKMAQMAVKASGLPGSGHGVKHGHGSVDRMEGADEIMSKHTAHSYSEISEITLLFNCFTLGYWLMHLMPVVIPTYYTSFAAKAFAHIMVLTPAMLLMQEVCPITTKYFCMLETMLEKDHDVIGEVYHQMQQLTVQKNNIKNQLQDVGRSLAKDIGIAEEDVDLKTLAELMFKEVDLDSSGAISYSELKTGMSAFDIYLSKVEFKAVMEIIDPVSS